MPSARSNVMNCGANFGGFTKPVDIRFRRIDDGPYLPEAMETFLRLFTMNREDKAAFMSATMASFFRVLAFSLAEEGLLRLFSLDLDEKPVASVFCFDHQGTRYLYNNGYDHAYQGTQRGLDQQGIES